MSRSVRDDGAKLLAAGSSLALRLGAWVFLRWIPAHHFPPLIYALFAVYVPAFWYATARSTPFLVIDTVAVVERDAGPEDAQDVDPRYAPGAAAKDPGKELVVEEEIDIELKDPQLLTTLLSGLPSPTSVLASAATFLINAALVAMTCDLVYRTTLLYPAHDLSMARVGFVSDTTAKILVREPDAHRYPVFASYRDADASALAAVPVDAPWQSGGRIDWMDNRTDFTGTFTLAGLRPDVRYEYVVSNNHTGFFTTAPRVGTTSSRASHAEQFTFVHSSCIKLNFPYSPFQHPLAAPGLRYLAQSMEGLRAQFMLFLGDFIYIDVPQRQGVTAEDYRREYRQVYSSPDWSGAARELPWIHVYDDHEIENDWDGNTTDVFSAANDAYQRYHVAVNPPAARNGETYFSFTQGPAAFFMLDTRRYRSPNDQTNGSDPVTGRPTKTMLGAQQLADLLTWLRRPEPAGVRWKVVISSVPFTKNWWFGAQDTWRGYLGERQIILEAMWDAGSSGRTGVVVLSGDRHEFAATAFPPPQEVVRDEAGTQRTRWPARATVHEFSVSPLNMFYLPVRTYAPERQHSPSSPHVSDVCVKYLPDGNSKFGAVSIANPRTSEQSVLRYRLFIDGVESWSHTLTTTG